MDDAGRLLGLAERLLAMAPGMGGTPDPCKVLPGELPSNLPLVLPLPPGAQLLGSMTRATEGRLRTAHIVVDLSQSEDEVLDFYRIELPPLGWNEAPPDPMRGSSGGFTTGMFGPGQAFCQGPNGPWLSMRVFPNTPFNDLRIHVNQEHAGPCSPQSRPAWAAFDPVLPPLEAPRNTLMRLGIGSGSSASRISEVFADTDTGAADLEVFFGQQLETAGWTRMHRDAGTQFVASTWRLPRDDEWLGVLLVVEMAGEHRRWLYLRAEHVSYSWRF